MIDMYEILNKYNQILTFLFIRSLIKNVWNKVIYVNL